MRLLKYIFKCGLFVFCTIIFLTILPYLWSPVYKFPTPVPFSGENFYNPYSQLDSTKWLRANFHAHTGSWGGMTNGNGTEAEMSETYQQLGYKVIGISNYQKITNGNMYEGEPMRVYEHGYGISKNHHLVMQAHKVNWLDFMYFQNLNHKQYMIQSLLSTADFVAINHPKFSRGISPEDMKFLSGYHCLEVLNRFRNSVEYWDSALSAGKPAFLLADDDVHNIHKINEVARCITVVQAENNFDDVIHSLKKGKSYGIDFKHTDNDNLSSLRVRLDTLVKPVLLEMSGDTMRLKLSKAAQEISLFGQNGIIRQKNINADFSEYVFTSADTYVRCEIKTNDGTVLYLNPIFRYAEEPYKQINPEINIVLTNLKRILFLVLLLGLFILIGKKISDRFHIDFNINSRNNILKTGRFLLIISVLIRIFLAAKLELGNDEVYYILYARYPDFSHFDHPPMIGWFIQLFSLNLLYTGEIFIRFSSIIAGTLNTVIIFELARKIKDEKAGILAAVFYNTSLYGFIINGVFILPDTPQSVFWLLALYVFYSIAATEDSHKEKKRLMLLFGFITGLAILSKYSGIFLWVGAGIYILFYDRKWLRQKELYISILITVVCFSPVIFWNIENKFISFTFHEERVAFNIMKIKPLLFLKEVLGQFLYINPINISLFLYLFITFPYKKYREFQRTFRILFSFALPLIAIFLIISFYRPTLPHWSGPAYFALYITGGVMLSLKSESQKIFLRSIKVSALLLLLIVFAGFMQINYGLFKSKKDALIQQTAKRDFTADMYGWRQGSQKFNNKLKTKYNLNNISAIVQHKWFPAAHIEYYFAGKSGLPFITLGSTANLHKYQWINKKNKGLPEGSNVLYITSSRIYTPPEDAFDKLFDNYIPLDTIPVYRDAEIVNYFFVFECINYQGK